MGRVARYKKTKSFDRNNKRPGGSGEYIWGEQNTLGLGDHRRTKKKRSQTAEKLHQQKLNRRPRGGLAFDGGGRGEFDAAPCEHDDFDLADLKSVKRQKKHNVHEELKTTTTTTTMTSASSDSSPSSTPTTTKPTAKVTHDQIKIGKHTLSCTIPQTDADERRTSRHLNLNHRTGGDKNNKSTSRGDSTAAASTKLEGRREGESITKFNKRLREETKMALLQDRMKSRKPDVQKPVDGMEVKVSKAQRRKEYLTNRKRKKKGGSAAMMASMDDDGYDSEKDDGKRNTTEYGADNSSSNFVTGERASFLDQAERPPTFQQLPRGAVVTKKPKMAAIGVNGGGSGNDDDGMDERKIRKEQNAMEAMRKRVVAQYAVVKARRRMERGDHS